MFGITKENWGKVPELTMLDSSSKQLNYTPKIVETDETMMEPVHFSGFLPLFQAKKTVMSWFVFSRRKLALELPSLHISLQTSHVIRVCFVAVPISHLGLGRFFRDLRMQMYEQYKLRCDIWESHKVNDLTRTP